ncbi:MAG: VPGUxxT family thioredoxin-like (seleno)protein, type 2 [Thermodesulfobacteriota bacterium]
MRIIISFLLASFVSITISVLSGYTEEDSRYRNAKQQSPTVTDNLPNHYLGDSAPIELGKVNWLRNFDEAVKQSQHQNKPLLVLFQEVPGCSTASGYGENVLSQPLIVEAVESLFVPVAIYNNIGGHDSKVLTSFGEPSWNNPVVRIITPDRKELVPRLSGDYSKLGIVTSMITALENNNQTVPSYLRLLREELKARVSGTDKAVFAMSCFWSGEEALGRIDGVISTNPGFMSGHEVVEVEYDPDLISYNELVNRAKGDQVADHVFVNDGNQKNVAEKVVGKSSLSDVSNFRPDHDPKHYLSQTIYRYVPMTSLQASRANAAIGSGSSPDDYLSPRQLELLKYIKNNPQINWQSTVGPDFSTAWNSAITLVNGKIGMK